MCKYYLILLAFSFTSCSTNTTQEKERKWDDTVQLDFKVPKGVFFEVGRSDIESIYTDAKWRTYCIFCDSPVRVPGFEELTTGELGLYLTKVGGLLSMDDTIVYPVFSCRKGDTDLSAYFYYLQVNGKAKLPGMGSPIQTSLAYKQNGIAFPFMYGGDGFSQICIWDKSHARANEIQHRSRMLYTLQPEVISYIRKNADNINPWFKEEAIRRGVFDTTLYPDTWINQQIEKNDRLPKTNWESLVDGYYHD